MKRAPRMNIAETFERPTRPSPVTLRVEHAVDNMERSYFRDDPAGYVKCVKRSMARQLAEHLMASTQLLSDEIILSADEVISLELTFNDRGTYENWLPSERREGKREGAREVIDALPYGMAEQDPT